MLPVAADITDLKRAEEIRSQYAAIVESSDDAIIAKNLDGVISAWNAAAERMFGYTAHEAIGQPITMIIPPDLHDEEHDILRRLRAGERIEHYETVRVTKAGERIDVSLTISPLRDPAGRIVGCSKIARDITKAKQARGRAAAKRATAGTRSGGRQNAPVDQHAPDFRVDAGILVCADSRRGHRVDGVRCGQRPDARGRPHVTEAPRVEEFPP